IINLEIKHTRNSFFALKNVLTKGTYNVCLVFNFQLTVLAVIIKRLYRLEALIFSRGINTFSEKIKNERNLMHKYINGFLIRKLYSSADFFIAQSNGMKDDMMESFSIPEKKIKVIFNPVFNLSGGNVSK